ncbi:MAG: hypothetical protein DRR16_33635 [Candidatus Parabeggiatoa sp. nov. 3]|nr:MAG: hypothetical protein DRR00_17740 [Gammaproteobacteria bacterium]RKZ50716.1 MAG: hypothetical protein DRQ99_33645 [Gammaproteobacteria bacterium]RKZ72839.1 MAG: hypothetical protein DRR16_33635 [Gammaproteobacteria bacterium]
MQNLFCIGWSAKFILRQLECKIYFAFFGMHVILRFFQPLYGCYVMGRLWFFVVLEGIEYSTSLAFDATKDDIKEIFGILQNTKGLILKLIN